MTNGDSNSTMIFAGAGASRGVGGDDYPTTVEFLNRVPDDIKANPLFESMRLFVEQRTETPPDIEGLLWALSSVGETFGAYLDTAHPVGFLLRDNRAIDPINRVINVKHLYESFQTLVRQNAQLRGDINKLVFDLYSKPPTQAALETTWIPLLTGAMKGGRVDVFTTNYDVIIEEAIRFGKLNIGTGMPDGVLASLQTELWNQTDFDEGQALLTKLHGSIVWVRNKESATPERVYQSAPFFQAHERHVILYPGAKGAPQDPLFVRFHDHFARRLRASKRWLFIGFAFRDEYINSLIEKTLMDGHERRIVVVNPNTGPGMPAGLREQARVIAQGFDSESVKHALAYLELDSLF